MWRSHHNTRMQWHISSIYYMGCQGSVSFSLLGIERPVMNFDVAASSSSKAVRKRSPPFPPKSGNGWRRASRKVNITTREKGLCFEGSLDKWRNNVLPFYRSKGLTAVEARRLPVANSSIYRTLETKKKRRERVFFLCYDRHCV